MLPRLRTSLDFLPSPIPDKPGLLIRDPFRFSDSTLVVPPPLVQCLTLFDGSGSTLDLREYLVRITGDVEVTGLQQHLLDALSSAGFLEDENFVRLKDSPSAPSRMPRYARPPTPAAVIPTIPASSPKLCVSI